MTDTASDDDAGMPAYRWEDLPPDLPQAILDALGGPEAARAMAGEPPVRVIRRGQPVVWRPSAGVVVLEDGATLSVRGELPPDLPLGYHSFCPDDGGPPTRLIVAPPQCLLPAARAWGWAAQLYAARSRQSWGIGDLADLGRLAAWSADLGAGLLMINPLAAVAPVLPQNASPYYPVSRRFRNPLYLRIEEVPGAERLGGELERLAAAGRALDADRRIDRDAVFKLKDAALRAIWAGFTGDAAFDRYCHEQGPPLAEFAIYCVLAEQFGEDWRHWPAEYRNHCGPAVQAFAAEHAGDVRFHQWLQWLLDEQLARAAGTLPLVQDLPIGMSLGGADAWAWQELLARDCTVGAPPDNFNPLGQDWQLPPFVPWKLRAAGYEPFIQTIRSALRHAGGLRIDHVMGLFRLWWIPAGHGPAEGAYVRYPADDLLAIVALESQRAGAFVVGEDLGTVEPGVRERLAREQILSVRLLWFEPHPPAEYPELAMASATTHDLPTIAGLWTGADTSAQESLGLPRNDSLERHLRNMLPVNADAPIEHVIEASYRLLAAAPCLLLLATLDDVQAVTERPNMPGTINEWPNWSLALPGGIEALEASDLARRIASVLRRS